MLWWPELTRHLHTLMLLSHRDFNLSFKSFTQCCWSLSYDLESLSGQKSCGDRWSHFYNISKFKTDGRFPSPGIFAFHIISPDNYSSQLITNTLLKLLDLFSLVYASFLEFELCEGWYLFFSPL